ncbi:unnamed protein product [Leptidea sinapis]|uniref:Uncharacterized protein n=1 Tax=Leptidea sinapis TaxID=189913 RepID=A0A5E4QNW5_9NEOP|nr:unnamed protein product [Leptidea sinapis]
MTQASGESKTDIQNVEESKTVQLLATGLLEMYEPPLVTINTHLKELTEKQDALADVATNKETLSTISKTGRTGREGSYKASC